MSDQPIIFLDIDGVLNDVAWRKAHTFQLGWEAWLDQIDPSRVELLNGLVEACNAFVVLSSSWRFTWGEEELTDLMREAGARFILSDRTQPAVKNRANAIFHWLTWAGLADRDDVRYVVLDDGDPKCDLTVFGERWIETPDGLETHHVDRALELLR